MAVANQKIVVIAPRQAYTKDFSRIHNEALQKAMQQLKGEHLKLWLYLIKNKDNYQLELSQKALEEWGLKKDSYYRAVESLVELGYLTPAKDGSNIYTFTEYQSNSQNAKKTSQNAKKSSDLAKETSQNPQRNTIHTINTITEQERNNQQVDYSVTQGTESKGTIENPIVVSKEWLISRYNELTQCKGDIYKYEQNYYKLAK